MKFLSTCWATRAPTSSISIDARVSTEMQLQNVKKKNASYTEFIVLNFNICISINSQLNINTFKCCIRSVLFLCPKLSRKCAHSGVCMNSDDRPLRCKPVAIRERKVKMTVKAFRAGSDPRERVKDLILDDHTACGCECGEGLGELNSLITRTQSSLFQLRSVRGYSIRCRVVASVLSGQISLIPPACPSQYNCIRNPEGERDRE